MTTEHPNIRVEFESDASRSHDIVFAGLEGLASHLADTGMPSGRCIVVTDSNVGPIYAGRLIDRLEQAGWMVRLITLPAGEPTKSMKSISRIIDEALEFRIDRASPVIALGGGVIGDVAGFAAAILLRGVPLVHVPTSLLAQVDSSIGGKTGINHQTGKNLIGAFHQPQLILSDLSTLTTLPQDEWLGGLSEVVKTALLANSELVDFLIERWGPVVDRRADETAHIVSRCAQIKVAIVVEDEREAGRRALLNLGHTFGHALEKVAGYRGVTHGIAVAAGMRAAVHMSTIRYPDVDFSRATDLISRLPSPRRLENVTAEMLAEAMLSDKKRAGGALRFILLERPGSAVVVEDVTRTEILESLEAALGPFDSGRS